MVKKKVKKDYWKVIAIISILLNLFFLSYLVYEEVSFRQFLRGDTECAVNVCGEYDSYYYNSFEKVCTCFEGDEIAFEAYIGPLPSPAP